MTTFTVKSYRRGDYVYHVTRVATGGVFVSGLVGKRFAYDYEQNWDGVEVFAPVPREPVAGFHDRTGANIITNASGWNETTGEATGLQIEDGILYHDFSAEARGRHSLCVMGDGSFRIYDASAGDTAAGALADGAVHSYSFGPPLVLDGVQQDLTGIIAEWPQCGELHPRTLLGQSAGGDTIIINVEGRSTESAGVGGNEMCALAFDEGCYQAILMDGGGSTQLMINGGMAVKSSDSGGTRDLMGVLTIDSKLEGPVMGFTYEARVAWLPEVDRPARGAVAQVFAYGDTSHLTPLPITDADLVRFANDEINSGVWGIFPTFLQQDHDPVRLWDGKNEWVLLPVEGRQGRSAYEVAQANGFIGTVQTWLESLRGAAGLSAPGAPVEDAARPGIYFMDAGSYFTEDPARPGIYTIGA